MRGACMGLWFDNMVQDSIVSPLSATWRHGMARMAWHGPDGMVPSALIKSRQLSETHPLQS